MANPRNGAWSSDFGVLRVPLLPLETLSRWADGAAGDQEVLRARLGQLLADPAISAALAVGSEDIAQGLRHWQSDPTSRAGRSAEHSLVRYLTRMAGRPTPFGLSSGYVHVSFGDAAVCALADRREQRVVRRIDPGLLQRLVAGVTADSAVDDGSRLRTNPLLYRVGSRYRVPRREGSNNRRRLIAVLATPTIDGVVAAAQDGATVAELRDLVSATSDEPQELLERLVRRDMLLPVAAVGVTGDDPARQAVLALRDWPGGERYASAVEAAAAAAIAAPDVQAAALQVRQELGGLDNEVPARRSIQVDTIRTGDVVLPPIVVDEVARAARLVATVGRERVSKLDGFRDAFVRRFGTRAVPLLEALDPDTGVRLDEHAPPPAVRDERYAARRRRTLQSLIARGYESAQGEVDLTDDDVAALSDPARPEPTGALAVLCSVAAADEQAVARGDFSVVSPAINAPGGGRLVGRFCHGDEQLTAHVRAHFAREAAAAPDDVLAEVATAPDLDWGLNVTHRPLLREFEIDLDGVSGAPPERRLPPSDLLLAVEDGQVVVLSRRLRRRVRPRSATALNPDWVALPAARFLLLLADAESPAGAWSWEQFDDAPFLPRIRRGRIVLAPRQWTVPSRALRDPSRRASDPASAVRRVHDALSIPRWVHVQHPKGTLLADLDNPISVAAVLTGNGRPAGVGDAGADDTVVRIAEAPFLPDTPFRGPDGGYAHELLIAFSPPAGEPKGGDVWRAVIPGVSQVPRRFLPGSPWLFAKLYGPASAADRTLTQWIAPLIAALRSEQLIDRWFFIRYADPDRHLRVRLHGAPDDLSRSVLPRLHEAVAAAVTAGDLYAMSLDTYDREVERYGGVAGVEAMEGLAEADSDAVLALLSSAPTGSLRHALAVASVAALYADAGIPLADRLACSARLRDAFARDLEPHARHQLGTEHRGNRAEVATIVAAVEQQDATGIAAPLVNRSTAATEILRTLIEPAGDNVLSRPYAEVVRSLAHMAVNRLLRDGGALDEVRVHDALARLYRERLARDGVSTAK